MASGWAADLLLGGIVLLGASVQRLAGIGFALVAVPALVLLLGPGDGVALANCATGIISAIALTTTWRDVQLTSMLPLVVAAAFTVPVGSWVARHLSGPVLLSGMGVAVTVAVLLVIRGARMAALRGRSGAVAAGAASGFMNASAGVGGPAMTLYAVNAGWTTRVFIPNAQFFQVVVNTMSLTANGVPRLPGQNWLLVAAGIVAGGVIGASLAERVPERHARRIMLLLALAGGLSTLAKGLTTL